MVMRIPTRTFAPLGFAALSAAAFSFAVPAAGQEWTQSVPAMPDSAAPPDVATDTPAPEPAPPGPTLSPIPDADVAAAESPSGAAAGTDVAGSPVAGTDAAGSPAPATEPATPAAPAAAASPFVRVHTIAEFGFLAPLAHTIQFSRSGTTFDYVAEGGQDVLVPTGRISAELTLDGNHTIIFLYQPLNFETNVLLDRAITVDDQVFPADSALDLRYGFDFYRLSYLYDFFDDPQQELSLGLSLQIRDAVINFTSGDGTLRRTNRDVGPVPELKLRGRYTFDFGLWLGGEVDGIYAPVKYLNGGKSDVVGAILDLNVRIGYRILPAVDLFLNLRWLSGGAEGTSNSHEGPGDGFVANWLNFLTVTLGAELRFEELL
jgi:hypothetical protein